METRTIFLIRHGRPVYWNSHSPMEFMSSSQFCESIDEYDNCTIDVKELPRTDTLLNAVKSDILFTSDLVRSIDSGKLFRIGNLQKSESLREVELPRSSVRWVKLPVFLWLSIQRFRWFLGNCKGCESYHDFKKRVRNSADFFDDASEYSYITIVAHGFFNRYLTRFLTDLKWQIDGKQDYSYWGVTKLIKSESTK